MKKRALLSSFLELVKGYWKSEDKWKAIGLAVAVLMLTLGQVYLLVMLNNWHKDFYNALQNYQEADFMPLIIHFTVIAFTYVIVSVYAVYLRQMLQLRWRIWMTKDYLESWMKKQVYYRLQVLRTDMDNPDQRISEDINQFISLTIQLAVGFIRQLTTLVAFAFILWELSGIITLPIGSYEFQVHGYLVLLCTVYAILGTWGSHVVGRKLIKLNFDQQKYEADFRFNMMRVRENSESIAFYGGEKSEGVSFRNKFENVIQNFWGLMKQTKFLNFYVVGYSQAAVLFPILLAAPRYFTHEISLGVLMQIISAFGNVQTAMSYFVESYDSIAQLVAVVQRLGGFTQHMEDVAQVESGFDYKDEKGADSSFASNLKITTPDGRVLLNDCSFELNRGERLLVTGNSGCGKSTLLRALAGLWPYGSGSITEPEGEKALFLPQRPYLPLGNLRQAIYYPQTVPEEEDSRLPELLDKIGLPGLKEHLDKVDDWSRILSLGEQQRIAFLRVLLFRPKWLFLDEATSAMDEPLETAMYELIKAELPDTAMVSVGHRSTLYAQHDRELHLQGDGSWKVRDIEA